MIWLRRALGVRTPYIIIERGTGKKRLWRYRVRDANDKPRWVPPPSEAFPSANDAEVAAQAALKAIGASRLPVRISYK